MLHLRWMSHFFHLPCRVCDTARPPAQLGHPALPHFPVYVGARARGAYMRCIEVARRWDAGLADQVSDPPHVFGLKCWKEFVSRLFGPQKPLFFVWHQGGGSSTPWEHPRTSQDMDQVLQEVLQRIEAVRLRERCGGQVGAC